MKGALINGFDRLSVALMRRAPDRVAHAYAGFVGRVLGPRLYPRVRALAGANLARLAPPGLEHGPALDALWDNMARSFLEVPRMERLWGEGRIAVEGAQLLAAAPRPLIVVGLHLGNWEAVGLAMVRHGVFPFAPYTPPSTAYRERVVVEARLRNGGRLLPPERSSARALLRQLRDEGDVLLIFCDELKGGVVQAPSFGRGPREGGNIANAVRLARATGAPLVIGWCERLPHDATGPRLRVTFERGPEVAVSADREADLRGGIAALDARMEALIRPRLPQWLMLHEWSERG